MGSPGGGEDIGECRLDLREIERLDHVSGGAELPGSHGVLEVPVGGDDDHRQLRVKGAQALEDHEAAHVRQADVQDCQGKGAGGGLLQAPGAGGAKDGGAAHAAGDGGKGGCEGVFVFDNQDHGIGSG
jgi:hypothetical protein